MSNLFKIGFNVLKSISDSSKNTIHASLNRNLNFEKVFLFDAGCCQAQFQEEDQKLAKNKVLKILSHLDGLNVGL